MPIPLIAAALIGGGATLGAAALDYKSQKKAISSAEKQRAASEAFIKKNISEARADIFKLFPAAQESRMQGLQAGLDLYKQSYPAMQQMFQQGNVGAQNTLIQGLPQIQNAIMGNPVNLSGLQPLQIQTPGLQFPQVNPRSINELGLRP